MRMNKWTGKGQELLDKLLALPVHNTCRHTVDTCTEGAIHKQIHDFEEELMSVKADYTSPILMNEIRFLKMVVTVYQDGRVCPGPEMMSQLKKLVTDEWRRDRDIVVTGIREHIIELEFMDICAINEWTPPEGFLDDINVRKKYR